MMKKLLLIAVACFVSECCFAIDPIVTKAYVKGSFAMAVKGRLSSIVISDNDFVGVKRVAQDLQLDLQKVTDIKPEILVDKAAKHAIIIGTIGHSKIIDELVTANKINVAGVAGKWESTLIEAVKNPFPGVDSALVIAGSDKRGTIYGVYELCSQIGVSPWYYWADVPIQKSTSLFVISGRHIISSPAVKYRGIFLNDEAPALSGWSKKEFGGFNHKFYAKVFELVLRLKGNYLWPAMWGSAFNDDDKLNPILADEYGVVIGTSHHEPLTRAHDEWKRYKGGKWNYQQNPEQLKAFWESGLARVADKEQIITVGMRGDGDEPMSEGTATALLEKIVKDQREIIEKVTKKPAAETPQIWALYKEVQDYYDQGMRVPDDVTLLLADDNWGNLRKLPKLNEAPRAGGYGIYYHFDYVGGPRNYKWINTNPIQKIWEQMHLAYQYNANQIWIVNVGDLKPMEFPISFFLTYAWAPDAIPAERLKEYTQNWVKQQFGNEHTVEIADLIDTYGKFAGRVRPELLNDTTYSLVNYHEFESVVSDFDELKQRAVFVNNQLLPEQRDAFYQLVLHPITALSNLYEMYFAVAKNKLHTGQGRISANGYADKVGQLYKKDEEITHYYNKVLASGKWDHMMDQTHIGYTNWQQPETNILPQTSKIVSNGDLTKPKLGVTIAGSKTSWTGKQKVNQQFPVFDYYTNNANYIELFNASNGSINYTVKAPNFIKIDAPKGEVSVEKRIYLSADWLKAPAGKTETMIVIDGSEGSKITVPITLDNRRFKDKNITAFVPQSGVIAMEAASYTKAVGNRPISWKTISGYGKTTAGVFAVPVTSPVQKLDANTPHLTYDFYVHDTGKFTLNTFVSPTIDFTNTDGLKFAVSVDGAPPIIVNISKDYQTEKAWDKSVAGNIKIFKTELQIDAPGKHSLKYWMINPGVVLQKLVIDLGGLKPSYLGPKETFVNRKD